MSDGVGSCWKLTYSREDMPCRCTAIKFAHDSKTAIKLLRAQLTKKGVDITDVEAILEP